MNVTRPFALALTGASAFALLTGARGCSGGATAYGYDEYGNPVYVEEPAVVVSGGAYHSGPSTPVVMDVVGDLAITVYAPYDDGVSPFTEAFDVTVREDSAYGPIVLQGTDFVFDPSGAGAVDLTDLPYGLYDIEVVGLDAYGSSVSYAAATVTVEEPMQYANLQLENSGVVPVDPGPVVVPVATGDAVLDIQEPDGGLYAPPTDTIDYYLWVWDEFSGQYEFVESVGYVPFDVYDPPVIPGLAYGWYYLEVDAFDLGGVKNYALSGEFEVYSSVTDVPVFLDYAQ